MRFRSLRPAREDAPVDQRHHVLGRDAAVAEQLLDAGIDGDDAVEDARLRVGVELDEDRGFVGHGDREQECGDADARDAERRTACYLRISAHSRHSASWRYFGQNGCLAVSFLAMISSIFGSPFMARLMASLVAS